MTRLQFLLTSILSALGSLVPWRRKRTCRDKILSTLDGKPPFLLGFDPAFGPDHSVFTYTLQTNDGKWQWRTVDGREMSPVFDSLSVAEKFNSNTGQWVMISSAEPSAPRT